MVEKMTKKKLIEVALPLEAINVASAREKSIRHGHPSTLHLWWARRPLAAARAVIFAQMVDDPSAHPDIFKTEKAQEKERQRLFRIIEELVKWENTTNETVLQQARDEIWQSWRYTCAENADHPRAKELFDRFKLPAFHDPFAGGGTLPLEAQRLGLNSYASDLNPVAVTINKAMIEVPPLFRNHSPVGPLRESNGKSSQEMFLKKWKNSEGLAEDVRRYGHWLSNEAEKRIGNLYPNIEITKELAVNRSDLKPLIGKKFPVVAWIWARTVKSPNPAFSQCDVPLISTYILCSKENKQAYLCPVVDGSEYRYEIYLGAPPASARNGTKISRGSFRCILSDVPIKYEYIDDEANAGRVGSKLLAIVAEAPSGRIYLPATKEQELVAKSAVPTWKSETPCRGTFASNAQGRIYGFKVFGDYFTPRQLLALNTFADLIPVAVARVREDALSSGMQDDGLGIEVGGVGATAYAEAVCIYLAFGLQKCTDYWNSLCTWAPHGEYMGHLFTRQGISMAWDYTEANPFSSSSGNWEGMLVWVVRVLEQLTANASGFASQADAQTQRISVSKVVSTDPPYYDNIGYADLSDFFYVWLRRSLRLIFPNLYSTMQAPKAEELVATPYRHGGKKEAEAFFLTGMTQAMHRLAEQAHPAFPVTIYYAFKQSEADAADGTTNTGWDTFLAAVIEAGFAISGTWPMRTEMGNRMVGAGANALASSILLVCRPSEVGARAATRREFVAALKAELPQALAHLQAGNIAPVDLAQAAIGPGMAVYTRYAKVLDAEGKQLTVRAALALINQQLDEALAEQEGDFDSDTRWALTWFEQMGFTEGDFGVANVLAQAKATGMDGLAEAGIIVSGKGKVRLLKPAELESDWDPANDKRLTVWEMVHQLVRVLEASGEGAASVLVAKLGSQAEAARELCYRLYTLCERKKRANEAMSYNGLVQSWPEITRLAREKPSATKPGTADLFNQE